MGNKTPPLVIPVVIDGSGVDKGLNNVTNRLRRGGGGGVSGGGGFGSGGGSALGVAAAAGFGAAGAAAFARGGGGGYTPQSKASGMSDFRQRQQAQSAEFLRNQNRGKWSYGKGFDAYARGMLGNFEYDPVSERQEAISGAHNRVSRAAANRERIRAAATRRKFGRMLGPVGRAAGAAGEMASGIGSAAMTAKGMLGAAGIGVSAFAAGKGAVNFLSTMSDIADPESAIGSPFYGRLRQTTNYFAQQPKRLGLGQGIIAGANMMGTQGGLNKLGAKTQAGIENIGLSLGMMLEGMLTDPMNTIGTAIGLKSSRNVMMKSLINGLMN